MSMSTHILSKRFICILFVTFIFTSQLTTQSFADTAESITYDIIEEEDITEVITENIEKPIREPNGVVDFLPLWQDPVYNAGLTPPKPFFVIPLFFYQDDTVIISNVQAIAHVPGFPAVPESSITMSNTTIESFTTGVRAGFWLLPFVSIHAMYAYTFGTTTFEVASSKPAYAPIIAAIDTTTEFGVHTYGLGTTAAYGASDLFLGIDGFSALDFTYTWSDVDLLNEWLMMMVFSARVGLSKQFANKMKVGVWVGGMYKDGAQLDRTVSGKYDLGTLGYATYTANQRSVSPWNMVAGTSFTPTRLFDIVLEFGFINRFAANLNLVFNF